MHVLFLCVANSARSQIAEGLARHLGPKHITFSSAGSEPTSVRPLAIEAMAEEGIDIGSHSSTAVANVDLSTVDCVITLCDDEVCPVIPDATTRLHWPTADPAGYEHESHAAQLQRFRVAREAIRQKLQHFFEQQA